MVTAVTAWAVGQRLKALALNTLVTAIQELQDGSARVYFEQTKTGVSVPPGETNFGAWTSSGGYTGTSIGVAVPTDGIYAVTMVWNVLPAHFSGRALVEVTVAGAITFRQNADPGGAENLIGGTCIVQLDAGDVIVPQRYQTNGTTLTGTTINLCVARIAI